MGVKGLQQLKCSCLNCRSIVTANQLTRHYSSCLVKGGKFIGRKYSVPISLDCQYCNKLCKNVNSLRQHEVRCKDNPNKIIVGSHSRRNKNNYIGSNQFTYAKKLGLPKPVVSKETVNKIIATKRKNGTLNKTLEQRTTTSIAMKKAVENNPESYTSSNRGRVKQIIYDDIKFIGQWEVDFYIWAKKNNLSPQRPNTGFPYEWNGLRTYFPDFYLPTLDLYVEVKGYETDRDRAKWAAFPTALCIIKKKEITEIRNGHYSVDKLLKVCYNVV
jgi:hypothetical protein